LFCGGGELGGVVVLVIKVVLLGVLIMVVVVEVVELVDDVVGMAVCVWTWVVVSVVVPSGSVRR
jgi:hypothetical protein